MDYSLKGCILTNSKLFASRLFKAILNVYVKKGSAIVILLAWD